MTDPQIGYVVLATNSFGQLRTMLLTVKLLPYWVLPKKFMFTFMAAAPVAGA